MKTVIRSKAKNPKRGSSHEKFYEVLQKKDFVVSGDIDYCSLIKLSFAKVNAW